MPKSSDRRAVKRPTTAKQRASGAKNLAAYRAGIRGGTNQKHGVVMAIKSGGKELPADAGEIRETVSALIEAAEIDLGGSECVTASQRAILESQRLCLTILALGARYLSAQGIVDGKTKKPQGLLSILGVYVNATRLNSLALGLERKAKFGGTLESHLQTLADRERAEEPNISESENARFETTKESEPGASR
jgi:hypothetical protein